VTSILVVVKLKAWVRNRGITKVTAKVPLSEMFGYATDIRSKTKGRELLTNGILATTKCRNVA